MGLEPGSWGLPRKESSIGINGSERAMGATREGKSVQHGRVDETILCKYKLGWLKEGHQLGPFR